jgi:hypothetical protein
MHINRIDNIEEIYPETPIVKLYKVPEQSITMAFSGFGDDVVTKNTLLSTSNLVNAALIAGIGAIGYFFIWPKIRGK